jgi:hypothetical protein
VSVVFDSFPFETFDTKSFLLTNNDNGSLVGDGSTVEVCEGAPLLHVKKGRGLGDQAVTLSVAGSEKSDPAEHGMSAVPSLGLGGGAPSKRICSRVLLRKLLHGLVEDRHGNGRAAGAHGNAGRREGRSASNNGEEGGKSGVHFIRYDQEVLLHGGCPLGCTLNKGREANDKSKKRARTTKTTNDQRPQRTHTNTRRDTRHETRDTRGDTRERKGDV